MAAAAASRMWEKKHDKASWHDGSFENWSTEWSEAFPFHRDDGVHIWVSRQDLTPDDDFI